MASNQTTSERPKDDTSSIAKQQRIHPGSILFGLLLIIIGVLFLLQNLGIADVNIGRIWQLWPLFIVAAGVSILPVRGWLATALVAVIIFGSLALVSLVALGIVGADDEMSVSQTIEKVQKDEAAEEASVSISSGAGNLFIDSDNMDELVASSLESNFASLEQHARTENGRQSVDITVKNANGTWRSGELKNELDVTLSEATPILLTLNTGASRLNADLSDIQLRQLNVKTGASTSTVKLGAASSKTDVSIEAGMSTVKILVPESSGLRLDLDAPLSSRTIPDLKSVGDNSFESDNYGSAPEMIHIKVKAGMANLTIEQY